MVFLTSVLAWFSLSAIGLALIVLSEPLWSRRPQRVPAPAPRGRLHAGPDAGTAAPRSCCGCPA